MGTPIKTPIYLFAILASSTAVFGGSFLTNAIIWRFWCEVVFRELSLHGFLSTLFLMENRDLMPHTVDWFTPNQVQLLAWIFLPLKLIIERINSKNKRDKFVAVILQHTYIIKDPMAQRCIFVLATVCMYVITNNFV